MLNDKRDACFLSVHRDNDAAIGTDVRLSEQRHFVTQNGVGEVVHDNLAGRTSRYRLLALHDHQAVWHETRCNRYARETK